MSVSRRGFFKAAGGAAAAVTLADWTADVEAAAPRRTADGAYGVLVDTTRCVGCRGCEAACSEANGLPGPAMPGEARVFAEPRRTDPVAYTVVNRYANAEEGRSPRFVKTQCLHCSDPACASACLVKAFEKTPEGPVVYNADRCLGCRYCMVACPFGVPKFEYGKARPFVRKCTFCASRVKQGTPPACAEVCPSGALTFGKRAELLEVARTRIYRDPERFVHHVYGEHEAGGTSWLYITDVPFEQLGFRTDVATTPYPELTWTFLSAVPFVLTLWPPFLMGLYAFTRNRERTARAEEHGPEEADHE